MGGWVFFAIFIIIAVVSAISHVLKNQQQQAEPPRRRQQQRQQRNPDGVRVSSDAEQDRFLAEIERLRKKATTGPRPVPTVKPAKAKKAPPAKGTPFTPRLEELPAANIASPSQGRASDRPSITITPPSNVATIASIATIHTILDVVKPADAGGGTAAKMLGTNRSASSAGKTEFARDLMGFFSSHKAVPMAVVLHEILGEPKSRKK